MPNPVVFGQVRPSAVFHIVWWRLMVVILLHGLTRHREFIHTARADSRSCLTAQNNLLRQLLIVFGILVGTIIESGYVHSSRHIIVDYSIWSIHTLSDRTGRVFAMTDILQHTWKFRSVISIPLVGHFITDTPHHNTRIIAIVTNKIYQVFLNPLIEYLVIAIRHFCRFPFIKWFRHQHHTHFITRLYQFRSRHIVRSTDGVTAHILQDTDLAADGRIIYRSSQRT